MIWIFNFLFVPLCKLEIMRTFRYTIKNTDSWRITDTEIVVIAEDKVSAKKLLKAAKYDIQKTSDLVELKAGVHMIQEPMTE